MSRNLKDAAGGGNVVEVKRLLVGAADVNEKDQYADTPLHFGHLEVAQALVQAGADITVQDDHGQMPLHFATEYDHEDAAHRC